MRIYSMTATFGKLEHQTLTLQPGLNIIEAPNEWGKTTWCAFLIAMLYGIDTKAKSGKGRLPDKERYAPWSGSPMSGKMDIHWNGRDITLERSSKARQPLGVFRAYETESGLNVPELTAENCGEQLLGVERNVFTKAGFLRLADLPVAEDEALRNRLNALVTTGDESGDAEILSQKLKDLKNKCRSNRSNGLIPAAEKQRDGLKAKLEYHQTIATRITDLERQRRELTEELAALQNHKAALAYAAAQADAQRLLSAKAERDAALAQTQAAEDACQGLPSVEDANAALKRLDDLRREQDALAAAALPPLPQPPETPAPFLGLRSEEALARAQADQAAYAALTEPKKPSPALSAFGWLGLAAGLLLLILKLWIPAVAVLIFGVAALIYGLMASKKYRTACETVAQKGQALCLRYGSDDPARWLDLALAYQSATAAYQTQEDTYRRARRDLDARREALTNQMNGQQSRDHWDQVIKTWARRHDARQALSQAEKLYESLSAMAKPVAPPVQEDHLTYSKELTERLLPDTDARLRQVESTLSNYRGQAATQGDPELLARELEQVEQRLQALQKTYDALELAQTTLTTATEQLQRRFAPRISRQARDLFEELTGGRYQELTLASDLSLHTAAQGEDIQRPHQGRSDGTIDQLYIALRLAVARELTPEAPLVLDDALVRFDDTRLAAILDILRREAEHKQVILFTCQSREKKLH